MSIYALEVEEFSDTTIIEISSKTGNPSDDKKSKVKEAHKKVTDFMKDQKTNIDKKGKSAKSSFDSLPILGTYTDESTNELVVILNNEYIKKPFNQYPPMLDDLIGKNVPVKIMTGKFFEQACNSQLEECRPLVGGIVESGNGLMGTITLPFADENGKIGFIISGHVARSSSDSDVFQPEEWAPAEQVGNVITDPDGPRFSDSAFVETLPEIELAMKIYKSPNQFYNVMDAKTSSEIDIGDYIYFTGKNSGESLGGLLAKDLWIENSEDYGTLVNQQIAYYVAEKGDSGGPIFEKIDDYNVNFLGIHVAKACFSDFSPDMEHKPDLNEEECADEDNDEDNDEGKWLAIYSPWEGIRADLGLVDFDEICQPPTSGNWVVTQDCIMISDATIDGNVSVESPSLLTVPEGVTLDIDFENQNLTVKSGAGVLIKQGGTIT